MPKALFKLFLIVQSFFVFSPAAAEAAEVFDHSHAEQLRREIRENFFIPNPLPPLNAETHRRFDPAPWATAEAVTYSTQFGMRVPAILYLPKHIPASTRIPGFIVVNGHGGDKYCWYAYYTGLLYTKAGAAVLTFDPAGEGERDAEHKSGTRSHDKLKGDAELARRLEGLFIGDVMQAVSYLASRPEVDQTRIAAGGYSLGSFILSITGAVEPRLRAAVLVGGGNIDGPGGYWDSSSKLMCQAWPYQSLNFLGDRPALLYALHAERGPTLIWNGRVDSVVNVPNTQEPFFDDLRARVVKVRGTSENVFEYGFTPAASHRPHFVTKPVALWLKKQLDFPNWSLAEIESMPETHIGEWSRANDILMDKAYATEEREGGTMALGTGFPGYRHDDLNVFSEEEWKLSKDKFVLPKWEESARAAEAEGRKPK